MRDVARIKAMLRDERAARRDYEDEMMMRAMADLIGEAHRTASGSQRRRRSRM